MLCVFLYIVLSIVIMLAKENEVILSNQNIISQNLCFEYILWMSYVNESVCMSVCIMPVHVPVSHLMLAWDSEMHRKHFFKVSPEMLREWKTKWNYFPDVYCILFSVTNKNNRFHSNRHVQAIFFLIQNKMLLFEKE